MTPKSINNTFDTDFTGNALIGLVLQVCPFELHYSGSGELLKSTVEGFVTSFDSVIQILLSILRSYDALSTCVFTDNPFTGFRSPFVR